MDEERFDPESEALPSLAHSPPQYLPQPPSVPSLADPDMRKVRLAAGGPNYELETVLRDTDIHMDSENIPSERCGSRRANLKRKARCMTRSVAEILAYCTLNIVSIEDSGDIIQTLAMCIAVFFFFLFYVYCMQSPAQQVMIFYTYLTF